MNNTINYNLNKPEETDNYNIEHQNDNMDTIDEKLKSIEDEIDGIEAPVTSVNDKIGDVTITKSDVGLSAVDNIKQATKVEFDGHVNNNANPHNVTKAQVGLGNVTNDAQLKRASNLSDLANVGTTRSNLGLSGSSNTTHYHDGRYVRTRISGGEFQYLDGGEWKSVGKSVIGMTPKQINYYTTISLPTSDVTLLTVNGSGVLSYFDIAIEGSLNSSTKVTVEVDGVDYPLYFYDGESNTVQRAAHAGQTMLSTQAGSTPRINYEIINSDMQYQFNSNFKIKASRTSTTSGNVQITVSGGYYLE